MRRKLIIGAVLVGLCAGVVVTRALLEGRSALASGDAAQAVGDTKEAIRWWRRAARWYVPWAPHVRAGYDRLQELATTAEQAGKTDVALEAWRGIRSSILATRSTFTPFSERLAPANRRIAALMAASETSSTYSPQGGAQGLAERTEWHYKLLARNEAPSVIWAVTAIFGFLFWISGGIVFAVRGVSQEDRLIPKAAGYAGLMIVCGLFIWMLGLYKA